MIHPFIVHFPIAFYLLELALLMAWRVKRDEDFIRFARIVFWAGYFSMLAALGTGWWASGGWAHMGDTVKRHFFSAISLAVFSTGRAVIWKFRWRGSVHADLWLFTSLVGGGLAVLVAYLGGVIVYS